MEARQRPGAPACPGTFCRTWRASACRRKRGSGDNCDGVLLLPPPLPSLLLPPVPARAVARPRHCPALRRLQPHVQHTSTASAPTGPHPHPAPSLHARAVHGQLLLAQRDGDAGARGLEVAHVQQAVAVVRPEVAGRDGALQAPVGVPLALVEAAAGRAGAAGGLGAPGWLTAACGCGPAAQACRAPERQQRSACAEPAGPCRAPPPRSAATQQRGNAARPGALTGRRGRARRRGRHNNATRHSSCHTTLLARSREGVGEPGVDGGAVGAGDALLAHPRIRVSKMSQREPASSGSERRHAVAWTAV